MPVPIDQIEFPKWIEEFLNEFNRLLGRDPSDVLINALEAARDGRPYRDKVECDARTYAEAFSKAMRLVKSRWIIDDQGNGTRRSSSGNSVSPDSPDP